jgi:nitroreductase/dihydropteridine reductase
MPFQANLEWRRAVKTFDTKSTQIPDIEPILNAAIQAPTSFGIQPWKILVITNPTLKEQLQPAMHNQVQATQSTHLLIFCTHKDVIIRANEFIEKALVPSDYANMIIGYLNSHSCLIEWAKHQTYIALGFALAAAAELKIASCPMEGFSPDGVASVLNLSPSLIPTAIMAIGNEDQTATNYPRFRFPREDLIDEFSNTFLKVKSKYRSVTPMRKRKTEN